MQCSIFPWRSWRICRGVTHPVTIRSLLWLCLLFGLVACGPVLDDEQATRGTAYSLDGFVPIESGIPNWGQASRMRGMRQFIRRDGSVEPSFSPNNFICESSRDQYAIALGSDGVHRPAVLPPEPRGWPSIDLPSKLEARIETFKSRMIPKDLDDREAHQQVRALGITYPVKDYRRLRGGWLVAFAAGEFGGSLIWLRDIGGYKVVSDVNTHDILIHEGVIYAGVGVDHFGTHNPAVLKIRKNGPFFNVETIKTESAVYYLDIFDEEVAGMMLRGLAYIDKSQTLHQRQSKYNEYLPVRFETFGFLPDGAVYVAGESFIGIYNNLPSDMTPELYIPATCDPIVATSKPYNTPQ